MGSHRSRHGHRLLEGALFVLGWGALTLGVWGALSNDWLAALSGLVSLVIAATALVAFRSVEDGASREKGERYVGPPWLGLWQLGEDGHSSANHAFCEVLGVSSRSKPPTIEEVCFSVCESDRKTFRTAISDFQLSKRPLDVCVRTLDGRAVRLRGSSHDGTLVIVAEDVTALKAEELDAAFLESRYTRMADNIPGVVYQMIRYADGSRKVPYINAAVEELFGVTREDVYADANLLIEAIHPEDREQKENEALRSMQDLSKFDWTGRIVRPDGQVRWVHALCVLSKLEDGAYHWDGLMLDVTDEKRAQIEHIETKERLAWLLKSSPVVIYACDPSPPYPLTYLSDNAADLLGIDLDEYRSDPFYWQKRIHPDHAASNTDILDQLCVTRYRTVEYPFRASGDEYRWVRDEMRLVHDEGRHEIVGTVVDVTERRMAEEALRDSEQRFRAISGASPAGVFVTDNVGSLVYANAKLAEILKVDVDRLLGQSLYGFLHGEDDVRARARIEEALRTDSESSIQCRFVLEDYTTIWAIIKIAPLNGAGVVAMVEDVTERHELEMQTEQARIAAERANQAKSAFLSRLSHEMRTPLHAVLGFAQLLQVSSLSSSQQENVEQIVSGGNHLLSLINDVLDIASAESGELKVDLAPVDLVPVVQEAVRLLSIQAREKNILIDVKLREDDSATLLADRKRLLQVLINVLSNAIKYNKREGAIIVSLEPKTEGQATLLVRDTGSGIPQDKVGRLFTPFDRLGAEVTDIEGSGLGLILSKRLVEAMGGTIRLESDVRTGTVATITLNRAQGGPSPRAAVFLPNRASTKAEALNVLLIEDNESNVKLFESIFRSWPQCNLCVCRTGRSGLELARNVRPELVLLDAQLPDVVGTSLLEELKKEPALATTKVVIVSAEADPVVQDKFLRAGAVAFLTKPLDVAQVFDLIDSVKEGARR